MEALRSQDLKNILNIVTMINTCLDKDIFRDKVLESFLKVFHMENSIFFLSDENSRLTDFVGKNIEEKRLRDFKNYYYKHDPFKLIQGPFHGNRIVRLEELVDYASFLASEYYNEFLRPQGIHYKTVVYLKSGTDLLGIIGLFRPKGFGNFSLKDIRIIKTLAPYLSQALEHIKLFRRIQLENSIFKIVDRNLSSGIIIFDDSMRLIYMNSKAKYFCEAFLERDIKHRRLDNNEKYGPFILSVVKEDSYHLREQMKPSLFNILPPPKYRILRSPGHKKYSICSQILTREMSPENMFFYFIKIDELISCVTLNMEALRNDLCLTEREVEILINIFDGFKNAEIAEKLSIREVTIKKHLQHIFDKIGVNSRTALFRRIVEYQGPNRGNPYLS